MTEMWDLFKPGIFIWWENNTVYYFDRLLYKNKQRSVMDRCLFLLLLPQLTLEDFMHLTAVERRGRKPQEYAHISRISDEVFRQPGKQKNSRVNWGSNAILRI